MRAILTSASFDPVYGGPAVSVSGIAWALAQLGLVIGLWAPNGTALTSEVVKDAPNVIRLGGTVSDALQMFGRVDVLHDSGLWLPHNHDLAVVARRRNLCRIVSPRGMLESWSLRQKRIKKGIAWNLYQRRDLASARALHATAPSEAASFAAFRFKVPTHIVANGLDIPCEAELSAARSDAPAARTAIFMSRIHPKKGLPLLLEAWDRLRPKCWHLRIAGPNEQGHSEEIVSDIVARGLTESVSIIGPCYGEKKRRLLATADLFILPTYSENFGIVVAEALGHETPVLTTRGAPWHALVSERCGWWVEPNVDALTAGLHEALATPSVELRAMGRRGREFVRRSFSWPSVAARMIEVYETTLRESGRRLS